MPRAANAVDFWRGFALVTIFINHVPGNFYERFTHRHWSLSDSAELFVFLAGWALAKSNNARGAQQSAGEIIWRLEHRALVIYFCQTVMTALAIAILCASALYFAQPDFLSWHNLGPVLEDPVRANIGLMLMSHQMGYFNILPLYVLLMALAPAIVLLDRNAPKLLLPISLSIYIFALTFRVNVPTWPVDGDWFLNPLAWQLIFILGFVLGGDNKITSFVWRNISTLRWAAVPIVIVGGIIAWFGLWPDRSKLPEPELFFVSFKVYLTPMRLIQFLALIAVCSVIFPYIIRALPQLAKVMSLLGRNSLPVFFAGSVLSLIGQVLRHQLHGSLALDTLLIFGGISLMVLTALIAEWPKRVKPERTVTTAGRAANRPASESSAVPVRLDGHSRARAVRPN